MISNPPMPNPPVRVVYRPKENHLAAIYRFGRFRRWVKPDQWTLLIPFIDEVKNEIEVTFRRTIVVPQNLLSADGIPCRCELMVGYKLNLPGIKDPATRAKAIMRSRDEWNGMIGTVLQETATRVFAYATVEKLLDAGGLQELKVMLSHKLSKIMRQRGVVIDPQMGVTVAFIRPHESVVQAFVKRNVAIAQGRAARDRIKPLLGELGHQPAGISGDVLKLAYALATMAGHGPKTFMSFADQKLGEGADSHLLRGMMLNPGGESQADRTDLDADDNEMSRIDW